MVSSDSYVSSFAQSSLGESFKFISKKSSHISLSFPTLSGIDLSVLTDEVDALLAAFAMLSTAHAPRPNKPNMPFVNIPNPLLCALAEKG